MANQNQVLDAQSYRQLGQWLDRNLDTIEASSSILLLPTMKRNKDNEIDPEFGITNREVRELQLALDGADFTKPQKRGTKIDVLGRKVLKHVCKKSE